MTLREELKQRIQDRGRGSISEVARAIGMSQASLSMMLSGKASLPLSRAEELLDYLGLELTIIPRQQDTPRLTAAGVPFTGDEETDWWLENQPDILERVAQHRQGQSELIPIADLAQKYGVEL